MMENARDVGTLINKKDETVAFAVGGIKVILKTADELIKTINGLIS